MLFSSPVLRSGVVSLAYLLSLAKTITALTSNTYFLHSSYSGANFFDGFDFYTGDDPTHGFVTYVDRATATAKLLISSAKGRPAYMGVDYHNTYYPNIFPGGRTSVRISTKENFTHGLIISDIAHMPGGICGTWPARPDWPSGGEIDIIEGVNSASHNLMSLHTSPNCTIAGGAELGALQSSNCDTTVNSNAGCGILADTTSSYGNGFNRGGGGIYATQWTSDYVRIWFFKSGSVPFDVLAGAPDPSLWGPPQANLQGSCDIDTHFANHNIIFDTTFCGDYAGNVWSSDPKCMALAPSCQDYVAGNPAAFQDAYWSINSVKVYKLAVSRNSSTPSTSAAASTTSSDVHFTVPATLSTSLSSMAPQSSVLAPGMGNTTAATVTLTSTTSSSSVTYETAVSTELTAVSTGTVESSANPQVVGNFQYVGCVDLQSGFSTFTQVEVSAEMALYRCTTECASYRYAGIFNEVCLCGNTLDAGLDSTYTLDHCDTPCPGNPIQICGGQVAASNRLAVLGEPSNSVLLSLYTNTVFVNIASAENTLPSSTATADGAAATSAPAAVVFGVSKVTTTSVALTSAQPESSVLGFGKGGGIAQSDMYTTVLTTVYVDVCQTGLATLTHTVTITHCSCTARGVTTTPAVTIPMTIVEKVCTACGESSTPSTLTVTVPITKNVRLDTVPSSSPVAATTATAATVALGGLRYAQPNHTNGINASISATVAHPSILFASAPGTANATAAFSATGSSSMVMFEGGAGMMAANLGLVLLGWVAVVML